MAQLTRKPSYSPNRTPLPLRLINLVLLLAGTLMFLTPLWWMFSTSLKSMQEIMAGEGTFFPKDWLFSNYLKTWNAAPFDRYTLNTLLLTLLSVIANVLVNAFVAFGFARMRFRGKGFLFGLVLATMMIPGFVTLIPQYILFARLGWVNTYLPLVVPQFFGNAFHIFLLRQFFRTIPEELLEAARMEGASPFYIWRKIAIPMVRPALATVAIGAFNRAWNDFLGPLLYVSNEDFYTVQIGLQTFKEQSSSQWNYLMAGSLLSILPVLLLFFFFQKYFIQGANITGTSQMDK